MSYDGFTASTVKISSGIAEVTLDHPPLNLLDAVLVPELKRFVRTVADDTDVQVVVFQSAVPDFFAAHVDAGYMVDATGFAQLGADDGPTDLNPVQHLTHAIRSLPQVTIAKLRGRLRGGGNEIAMACDLRYAAAGTTWLSQIESRMGIIPGGGGTQLLPPLVGRARALEVILTGDLIDAVTAEQWGWINRAVPDDELDDLVSGIATRIAGRSGNQIAAAKAAVSAALGNVDLAQQYQAESAALGLVYPAPPAVVDRMARALDGGLQTPEQERDLEHSLDAYA
ncbi:enoyl-CoA hydratase/isomerase family protein [Actinoplanes sp. N902-109]|uniref:enoyl-CoA hydratase/isomerase family protein n=1 Tax=Actinoplanes sp. (strain N902-109) TaxID=649831 RepID=UPI0003295F12|nr:enoyl-CoA hydratase/isomerase family protein [Actinoplanes sp. N902-109]AGL16444.1 enoyl-CoA hydratase/isomerase [Actinoplanes sp. N902-109]